METGACEKCGVGCVWCPKIGKFICCDCCDVCNN